MSKIEWTEKTWNPVTGCTKVSPGCKHCYAERMARRLKAMGQKKYRNGFHVTLHPETLSEPLTVQRPTMFFVNSMSDLFHKEVPLAFIQKVFAVMNEAKQHPFQVLTKRSERLVEVAPEFVWSSNIWLGMTVETQQYVHRIDHLRQVNAPVRFLSLEPLLGPMPCLNMGGIAWVIVGGESGPGARPMKWNWVTDIRDQCIGSGVPFFFKQWGGVNKKAAGRTLEGTTWDEMPEAV